MIYKNIESCCTKNSNLKKKSNLSCNSLKFKSITQDENNACKIRASSEVFVFVCGIKISFRKKIIRIVYIATFVYVDIRVVVQILMKCFVQEINIAWRFDSLSRRSGSNESPKRYSQFWSKAKL